MQVSVASSIKQVKPATRDTIGSLLSSTFARLASRITRVSVQVVDENGPRGGVDKRCRINVLMPGVGTITTTARHEKLMVAVNEAARRARRIVVTKLKRPHSLRLRRRTKRDPSLDSSGAADSE